MGTFHLHESNRVERLALELAGLFEAPRGDPFRPEAVVVPGRGMAVWLSMQLSRELGVWAAPFSYPRALVETVARAALGEDVLGPEPLSQGLIEWCVRATLPVMLGEPEFARLRYYLEDDEHGVRLGELAARVASVFDQYLTYRPLWIRTWQAGGAAIAPGDERWQAILWQRVSNRLRQKHVAHVEDALLARLAEPRPLPGLPPRVSLFGLSTLPPLYVRVLVALSRHVNVHLFRFRPGATPAQSGEPLESLGLAGDEFATVLHDTLEHQGITPVRHHDFSRAPASSLLSALKARLASGEEPLPASQPLDPPTSPSIAVHSCHGAMREVEVLHDQLLALLTREDDPVAPDDVVVLVPSLESYAPLVEAVFRRELGDPRFVPFRIADRSARRESAGFDAFLRVLGMVRGRVTAADIADLLGLDAVQARLGLGAESADRLKAWILESGIRWGLDGAHLEALGLPSTGGQTWEFGLRRLLVGYALPSAGRRTFHGVLGYDEVEGKDGALLGTLAAFVRTLGRRLRDFERPRGLPDWTLALSELARDLFADDEAGAREIALIQGALDAAGRLAAAAGFVGELDVVAVHDLLERQADALGAERGFLAGGVTFSAMVPMRSIPFRVVALLGMNDGEFPRAPRPVEFDLTQSGHFARSPGDRSSRDDDRQLFLETLFAAQEQLIVTYSGKSMRDDRAAPPSACLGELLEALTGPTGAEAKQRQRALVVEHKLQGYSPAYFDGLDARLFSYRTEYERAAASVALSGREARAFVGALEPVVPPAELSLDDLSRFWKSPPAYLLNRRLGIYLKDRRPELNTREPLEFDFLEAWQVATPLIEALLDDPDDSASALDLVELKLRAEGRLPVGGWGRAVLEKHLEACVAVARATRKRRGTRVGAQRDVEIALPGLPTLKGSLRGLFGDALVEHGYSKLNAKWRLELWLRHLCLCASSAVLPAASSVRVARPSKTDADELALRPLARELAREHLCHLVRLFLKGQSTPLPFLPAESLAYVELRRAGKPVGDALFAAVKAYEGEYGGLSTDPHAARAFDERMPPFDAAYDRGGVSVEATDFHALAEGVFGPCLDATLEGSP